MRVEGKDVAVAIYEPLGLQGQAGAGRMRERELFHDALALCRAQRWDGAEAAMQRLNAQAQGGKRYASFIERIACLRTHSPDAGRDGAVTFTTK